MALESFHHVAIIVSNYERSKKFYTEVLGLSILAENYRVERESYKLDLQGAGGIQLELFTFPGSPPRISRPEAQGLRHLAFTVANVENEIARLEGQGVTVEPLRIDEYTGKKFCFFTDPDGLPIELYEK